VTGKLGKEGPQQTCAARQRNQQRQAQTLLPRLVSGLIETDVALLLEGANHTGRGADHTWKTEAMAAMARIRRWAAGGGSRNTRKPRKT
jgi:hypothetical protein